MRISTTLFFTFCFLTATQTQHIDPPELKALAQRNIPRYPINQCPDQCDAIDYDNTGKEGYMPASYSVWGGSSCDADQEENPDSYMLRCRPPGGIMSDNLLCYGVCRDGYICEEDDKGETADCVFQGTNNDPPRTPMAGDGDDNNTTPMDEGGDSNQTPKDEGGSSNQAPESEGRDSDQTPNNEGGDSDRIPNDQYSPPHKKPKPSTR